MSANDYGRDFAHKPRLATFEATDGEAAAWLLDLSNFYDGQDQSDIIRLARRLQAREDAAVAAVLDAREKVAKEKRERVKMLEDEVECAERDLDDARRELEAAG